MFVPLVFRGDFDEKKSQLIIRSLPRWSSFSREHFAAKFDGNLSGYCYLNLPNKNLAFN